LIAPRIGTDACSTGTSTLCTPESSPPL
jgi:hypothetical protein